MLLLGYLLTSARLNRERPLWPERHGAKEKNLFHIEWTRLVNLGGWKDRFPAQPEPTAAPTRLTVDFAGLREERPHWPVKGQGTKMGDHV